MADRGVSPNQKTGKIRRRGYNFVGDQPDLVTSYSYDAKNRKTSETVSGGGLSLTATWQYNPAGQLIQTTDATGAVTSYSYANGVNSGGDLHGGRTVVTLSGNRTKITETFCDGRISAMTGNAQTPIYFD